MNINKLMRASLIGVMGLLTSMVQAQNTIVTNNWNVTPWNVTGPTLQAFETMPSWAIGTGNTNNGAMGNRSDRFWTNEVASLKSLIFSTSGITNTFSGAKIQPGVPIFVDMRCKIYPFASTPPTVASNTVLSFYSDSKSNLVVASYTSTVTCKTNINITILTNVYYSVMIRFAADSFDVFFDNSTTNVLSLNAATNQISKMVISGDGELDDLYISYGDPRRSTTNYFFTGWTPSTPEESVVASWVASQAATNSALVGQTITSANAINYYLTDTALSTNDFTGQLGIGSINYNPSSTSVTVVVTLKTDGNTKKSGKINGVLKLKGAATYAAATSGTWSGVLNTVKIGSDDFNNGLATYTFTLPDTTYKFFLPVIQSNIQ
jgi:hypothetical protein